APKVGGREARLRTFARVEHAPILVVDVKVVVITALALLPHGKLRVAGEHVAHEDAVGIALETPRVILERAQVEPVELAGAVLRREQRKFQLSLPVFIPKEKAERVFGIVRAATEPAANA